MYSEIISILRILDTFRKKTKKISKILREAKYFNTISYILKCYYTFC